MHAAAFLHMLCTLLNHPKMCSIPQGTEMLHAQHMPMESALSQIGRKKMMICSMSKWPKIAEITHSTGMPNQGCGLI